MSSRQASGPYRIAAVVLLVATFVVDTLAKLGPLGNWSAVFDVTVNLLLIIGAITAIIIGQRKDQLSQQSDLDNDY